MIRPKSQWKKGKIMIKTAQVQGMNEIVVEMFLVSEGHWNPDNYNGYTHTHT